MADPTPPERQPRWRAHVFFYPHEAYCGRTWTWCPEVNGKIYDHASGLPRCESWADAFARASVWLQEKWGAPDA